MTEKKLEKATFRKNNTLFYVANRFVFYAGALSKKYTWELSNFYQPEPEFKQLSVLFIGYASILFRTLIFLLSLHSFSVFPCRNKEK